MDERDLLLEDALYEPDPVRRDEARGKLAREATEPELAELVRLLDASHRGTRRRAARILSEVEPPKVRAILVDALRVPPVRIQVAVARILSVLSAGDDPILGEGLKDPEPRVRRACATAAAPVASLAQALLDDDLRVVEAAAEALEALDQVPEATLAEQVAAKHAVRPPPLTRLLARALPHDPGLIERALGGDETALDHLADEAALHQLLDGPHRLTAAWGLAAVGQAPERLIEDEDPRVRAALARALAPDSRLLSRLLEDPDPGVRWLAQAARRGEFSPERVMERQSPHPRASDPSAKPPYGLKAGDSLPTIARVHAALALCHTRFDINLGVAVRSAEAAGLREVILVGRGELLKSPARGTDLILPIRHVPDSAALLRLARAEGYQLVAVQQTAGSVSFMEADYPPCPLFVLGAEDTGVPMPLRRAADLVVDIPQYGVIDSLNVAAAATCVVLSWRARVAA